MPPFDLILRPGISIFDQLVSAAQKAILGGELSRGDPFPSLRTLAAELKIHPNTAHKAVQYLIQEHWLEMKPGIGTVVAGPPRNEADLRRHLIEKELGELVRQAVRIGFTLDEIVDAIRLQWPKAQTHSEVEKHA